MKVDIRSSRLHFEEIPVEVPEFVPTHKAVIDFNGELVIGAKTVKVSKGDVVLRNNEEVRVKHRKPKESKKSASKD